MHHFSDWSTIYIIFQFPKDTTYLASYGEIVETIDGVVMYPQPELLHINTKKAGILYWLICRSHYYINYKQKNPIVLFSDCTLNCDTVMNSLRLACGYMCN